MARATIDLLPAEDVVYFGDTGRYPYGSRPLEQVRDFALQVADWLVIQHDPKMLVVACNTATAAALDTLADTFDVPVIGVIEPGVRALLEVSGHRRVGVLGTVGTIRSGAYQELIAELDSGVELTCAACPGFVEFVERGAPDSDEVHVLAQRLLAPVVAAEVDALLLGCTHYPYLSRTIQDVVGSQVVLVSSADETAFAVRDALDRAGELRPPGRRGRHRFVSSGDVGSFRRLGRRLLGPELAMVESLDWADELDNASGIEWSEHRGDAP